LATASSSFALCVIEMNLDILPVRAGGAAENMACDFLLLQRYPRTGVPRFRHYGWHRPAFTFGYSQKISFVRTTLPADGTFDLCRRPTGGGLVDHRDDWTYALVIPRGHPLEELRATQSYRDVHECLAAALCAQGVAAVTKPVDSSTPAATGAPAGICFERAEFHDVVHEGSGEKIAGAAQKRNKHGLLFQGSIWRPAAGAGVDWDRFHDDFTTRLTVALGTAAEPTPWPDFLEDEVNGLVEQYSSKEWMEYR
jgi:lipoate-protein ligase A